MSEHETVTVTPAKILVPIDFSPSSHQALDAATELALKFGAELTLLHVVPDYLAGALPVDLPVESIMEAERVAAEERFRVSKKSLEEKGIRFSALIETGSDVAATILETVESREIDLVVFTTHGMSGWYPQVFGSIAEKLVRLVHCPILLLRTPKPERSAKVSYSGMMEWW